ncbi:MAG TPA: hemerythrin domain-containing protein [Thermodesulfobacteriota bacterium]|nr:hemerythrin domain-containing protein [Thermodesulfobacteriota bacterium]
MEIYQLLKNDHVEAKQLFNQLQSGGGADKESLLEKLEKELTIHMEGEEKLFYPRLQAKFADKVAEGIKEHNQTREHLKAVKAAKGDASKWQRSLLELMKGVDHHVQEEEGEVFPKAKSVLNPQQAEQIGQEFQSEKQKKMTVH